MLGVCLLREVAPLLPSGGRWVAPRRVPLALANDTRSREEVPERGGLYSHSCVLATIVEDFDALQLQPYIVFRACRAAAGTLAGRKGSPWPNPAGWNGRRVFSTH